jgi:hypothetical protein
MKQLTLFHNPSEEVYFATDGEYIKIGRTSRSTHRRLQAHQTGNARRLTILAVCPGLSERALHQQFARDRVNGEWFKPSNELGAFISAWQTIELAMR